MIQLIYRFAVVVITFFAQHALGQNLIQPFPDQRVMYASSQGQGTYPLTLGTFEKINGEWTAVKEAFVEGRLETATFEITRPYTLYLTLLIKLFSYDLSIRNEHEFSVLGVQTFQL